MSSPTKRARPWISLDGDKYFDELGVLVIGRRRIPIQVFLILYGVLGALLLFGGLGVSTMTHNWVWMWGFGWYLIFTFAIWVFAMLAALGFYIYEMIKEANR